MVFKGTKKWPTALDLAAAVDSIGAEFNAFTGKEYTGFYVKSDSRHVDLALDVISDMIYTAILREEDLEREKGVIVEEINMYNDLPQRKVGEIYERAIYGNSGLGRRIDGERDIVKSFVREDFTNHLMSWYGPKNVCVIMAGDADKLKDENKIATQVEELFSKGELKFKANGEKKLGIARDDKNWLAVEHKDSDQAHLVIGFPGIGFTDKRRYALSILSVLMGGNMSSRLFTEIREKRGLAYYSRSDVDRYMDTGSVGAVEGVDTKRVEEAIKVTMEVFNDVKSNGENKITDEEIARSKEFLAGSMILDMEDSRSVAEYWASKITLGDELIDIDEVIKRIKQVTKEEVVAVANELLDFNKLVLAVVGPYKEKDKFEKLISSLRHSGKGA
jgi:predicted Zn-dependent peptidase